MSTRDTVPGGHFDQNINGITKQNIVLTIDMQQLGMNKIIIRYIFGLCLNQKKPWKKWGVPGGQASGGPKP